MSLGKGFTDSFLGMNQFSGAFRKQPQDLSPGGRKQNLGTGFGLGKPGFKMGMYKDDNDSEDDFASSLLNKPGYVQKSSDRDLSQHMSHLNLYGNQSDSRAGTWNGSTQSIDDQRAGTWNGGQSFDAIVSQTSQNNPFSSSSLHNSDATADLWSRGSTSQSGGLAPYSSMQMPQSSRGQNSTIQFSRSFSQPQSAAVDRFNSLTGSSAAPISTGFQHIASPTSGQTSPGRNGLLSLGGRSVSVQLPSNATYSQSQSLLNNAVSKTVRPSGLPSSLSSGSRSSPNLLPLGTSQQQQQQQQQPSQQQTQPQNAVQQPPHRVGSFGSLTSSGVFSGFGTSRSLSTGSQVGLLSHVQNASSGQSSTSVPSALSSSSLLGESLLMSPFKKGSADNLSQVISSGISNFDLEFPVLANRGTPSSSSPSNSQSSSLPPRTGYGGALQSHDLESFVMVTGKNQESGSEFQIQNEDFPALPGSTQSELSMQDSKSNVDILFSMKEKSRLYPDLLVGPGSSYESVVKDGRAIGDKKSRALGSVGIQTSSSGVITNIPVGMVTDQFGMIGLLTFIRAAETDPDLVTLALGSDLTTLGLNLNSTESLHHTFGSPFSDTTCRPHEIDYHVPPEYLVNTCIRDRLAQVRLNRYCEDLLFYLYYTNCGDIIQLAAAAELFSRDWRYHKEERVWITRAPGMDPQVKTSTYERGTYHCFDQHSWRKVAKEFHVEYDKLEEKPSLNLPPHQQSVA